MKRSAEVDQIIPAFVALLSELEDITKTRTAKIPTKTGGEYRYTYADLGDVLDVSRAKAAAQGLAITQEPQTDEHGTAVATHVLHVSGQWLEYEPLRLPTGNDAQSHGSAITFARRYTLLSVLGLATEDDDGAAARSPERHEDHGGRSSAPRGNGQETATEPPHVQAVADEINKGIGYIVKVARDVALGEGMEQPKSARDISPELIVLVREKLGLA